jgi:hypothetical protein
MRTVRISSKYGGISEQVGYEGVRRNRGRRAWKVREIKTRR